MRSGTSPGFDDVHITVVKKIIHLISKPLCAIFNSSLKNGIFPDKLKVAKVIPIFKKGQSNSYSNY